MDKQKKVLRRFRPKDNGEMNNIKTFHKPSISVVPTMRSIERSEGITLTVSSSDDNDSKRECDHKQNESIDTSGILKKIDNLGKSGWDFKREHDKNQSSLISDDGIKIKSNANNIKDIAVITTTDTDTNRCKINDSRDMQCMEIEEEPINENKKKKCIDLFCIIRVVSILLLISALVGIILWNIGVL